MPIYLTMSHPLMKFKIFHESCKKNQDKKTTKKNSELIYSIFAIQQEIPYKQMFIKTNLLGAPDSCICKRFQICFIVIYFLFNMALIYQY